MKPVSSEKVTLAEWCFLITRKHISTLQMPDCGNALQGHHTRTQRSSHEERLDRLSVHLVNPSDNSFGTAVITPRWLFVLAALRVSFSNKLKASRLPVSLVLKSARVAAAFASPASRSRSAWVEPSCIFCFRRPSRPGDFSPDLLCDNEVGLGYLRLPLFKFGLPFALFSFKRVLGIGDGHRQTRLLPLRGRIECFCFRS